MTTLAFDTLAFSQKLQESGMPQAQAETLAKVQKEALEEIVSTQDFATKADIRETEPKLQTEIQKAKHDLLKWQLGIGFALVVIMAKGFGWIGF